MNLQERIDFIKFVFEEKLIPILEQKGSDYGKKNNINSSFIEVAKDINRKDIDKYDVWQVFFNKHLIAIRTWLEDRSVQSEPIDARIGDAINYLFILWSMLKDDNLLEQKQKPEIEQHFDVHIGNGDGSNIFCCNLPWGNIVESTLIFVTKNQNMDNMIVFDNGKGDLLGDIDYNYRNACRIDYKTGALRVYFKDFLADGREIIMKVCSVRK